MAGIQHVGRGTSMLRGAAPQFRRTEHEGFFTPSRRSPWHRFRPVSAMPASERAGAPPDARHFRTRPPITGPRAWTHLRTAPRSLHSGRSHPVEGRHQPSTTVAQWRRDSVAGVEMKCRRQQRRVCPVRLDFPRGRSARGRTASDRGRFQAPWRVSYRDPGACPPTAGPASTLQTFDAPHG